MAVQRRIIWLDDQDWEALGRRASDKGLNISRYLAWQLAYPETPQKNMALGEPVAADKMSGAMSQAQRDAILRKMSKTK